jgi:hypothetical protein
MDKIINIIFRILVVVILLLLIWVFIRENQIKSQIIEANKLFLKDPQIPENLDLAKYESYVNEYIINQKHLKSNWWDTIINQSGLSIIFTAVVLFITVTFSFFTQSQIDNKFKQIEETYKKDIQDSDMKLYDTINDVILIVQSHNISMYPEEYRLGKHDDYVLEKLNKYNDLKHLNRESLDSIYQVDVYDAGILIGSQINQEIDNTLSKKVEIQPGRGPKGETYNGDFDIDVIRNEIIKCVKAIHAPEDKKAIIPIIEEFWSKQRKLPKIQIKARVDAIALLKDYVEKL